MASEPGARYVIGLDGGGTATRMAVADDAGGERLRRTGPAGLVDPRQPAACAATLSRLIQAAAAEADVALPVAALCAGLAGAGSAAHRQRVRDELAAAGVADRIVVVPDGEIALEGALAGGPGVLLVAGTGSGAWGRGEDGQVARCGGWGMRVGDEGSGYAIGRDALRAALLAVDGRGQTTTLLPELLSALELGEPEEIPAWVGRADKADIAALAPLVIRRAASGDAVAAGILDTAADDLARHVEALTERLGPWPAPVGVVFHGGVLRERAVAERVEARLGSLPTPVVRREAAADAVTGAVRRALALLGTDRRTGG